MPLAQPAPDLLRQAQLGDEQAFARIVRMYEQPVSDYVRRLVHDRSLAEDLTQDVFLLVYQALPRFAGRCLFTTWLFQVTKNRVFDELRSAGRRPRVEALDLVPESRAPERRPEDAEAMTALWRAVGNLNLGLRMALLLRDVVGLSYGEIAGALEIELSTVKWRIFHARELVQEALQREGHMLGRPAAAAAQPHGEAPAVASPVAAAG